MTEEEEESNRETERQRDREHYTDDLSHVSLGRVAIGLSVLFVVLAQI